MILMPDWTAFSKRWQHNRQRLRRLLSDVMSYGARHLPPKLPEAGTFYLAVTGGRHAGAKAQYEGNSVTVGASLDCDLVLAGDQLAADHLTLEVRRTLMGTYLAVRAREALCIGDQLIAAATTTLVASPVCIQAGGATIDVTWTAVATECHPTPISWGRELAIAALIGVAVFQLPNLVRGVADMSATAYFARSQTDVAVSSWQAALVRQGLTPLRVTARSGGGVAIEGLLPPEDYQRWLRLRSDAAESKRGAPPLLDRVMLATETPAPLHALSAVSLTGRYVITSAGRKAAVGDMLDDGWVIAEIRPEGVTLKRDTARAVLSY